MLTRDNMEIDLKDLNQLCCALDAIRFYQKSKGFADDALQNQALKEASEKLSKLNNLTKLSITNVKNARE